MDGKLITLQRHIAEQQAGHPEATGRFTRLMWDLMIAVKQINREVNKAGLTDVLGKTDATNATGDTVAQLDRFSQDAMCRAMNHGGHLCVMASEESDEIITIPTQHACGEYVLVFDPLDGSSNIDANVSIGTIFSIYRRVTAERDGSMVDVLQAGTRQICAGYVIYGSSTMLVYTVGQGVHGFTLDPSMGEFFLSHPGIRIPKRGRIYSINEGNSYKFDEGTRRYLEHIKTPDLETGRPYSGRYIGSLVADFHRNLLYGGVYLYPGPNPKLRLVYEANPMAYIAEQAGGMASDGTGRILEIQPRELHERVELVIGSVEDVAMYERFRREHAPQMLRGA